MTTSDDALRLAAEMRAGTEGVSPEEILAMKVGEVTLLLDTIDTLRCERDEARLRGDNHWETLRGIRDIAKTSGDLQRIILWVDDAGSGYTDTAETTLAALTDRSTAAESTVERLKAEIARKDAALRRVLAYNRPHGEIPSEVWAEARAALQPTETPDTVAVEARPDEEVRGINWLWYSEDAAGQHVTFGRWPKFSGAVRFKRAEIQPTEHDHLTLPQSGAGEPQPAPKTWRDLDAERLMRAIDAFYNPCEGTTIDGVRAAILAWEQSR